MKNIEHNMRVKAFIAIVVVLTGLRTAAFAEDGVGGNVFSIGPRATYVTPKDADTGQWAPGVQARLHLSEVLGAEASIDFTKYDFGPYTTVRVRPVQASLLAYLIPGGAVSPFLLGGAGWYYTQVDGPFGFSRDSSRFGLHAGAGLEVKLNKSLSLDGTYRYVWLESLESRDANALDKTYKDTGSMITLGLNLLF